MKKLIWVLLAALVSACANPSQPPTQPLEPHVFGAVGVPISGLPAATLPVAGTEVGPIVQAGATAKVSLNNMLTSGAFDNLFCTTQGAILFRNATTWVCLGPGMSSQVLQTQGAAANPQWANAATGTVMTTGSPANGNLTKFSGATSITNADLTGAVTTSGGVATTIQTSINLPGSPTTTTQSAKDNSTKIATTAYVDAPTGLTSGTSVTLAAPRQYFVCTSTCTITMPVPAAGYEFCVLNSDNVSTVITFAAIGSSARYENTARTAYGTAGTGTAVSGGAVGDKLCLLGLDSTHYLVASFVGTWTMN